MAFNEKEQAIIKYGLDNGKSRTEVEKALSNFRNGVTPTQTSAVQQEPGVMQRVGSVISNAGAGVNEAITSTEGGSFGKGVRATASAFNAIPQVANELLPQPVRSTLSKVGEKIGQGFNFITDKVAQTKLFSEVGSLEAQGYINSQTAPELYKLKENLRTASAGGEIANTILAADQITKTGQQLVNTGKVGATKLNETVTNASQQVKQKLQSVASGQPEVIMNRVARLTPTSFNKFKNISGQTPGEYLTKTGNFGTPDKIVMRETEKFINSMNSVDTALEKLPGVYKSSYVEEAFKGLIEKAQAQSSGSIRPPFYNEMVQLLSKYNASGLTQKEINIVKRMFEKNVKLADRGVAAQINADAVKKATYIDDALRNWQIDTASKLGFENIRAMNKQTQISRTLANELGKQIVGKSGLNGLNITDWIMLSGGDAASISGFLTKKFFSDAGVQARIAQFLNKAEITPEIKAILNPTQENAFRQVSPQGLTQLPEGKTGVPQIQNNVPIERTPAYSQEPQAVSGTKNTINKKTGDVYVRDIKTNKVIRIIRGKQK